MEGRSGMRAADADREATAARLRVALEEGRLDLHEYDERLVRAYGAKTYAELDEVVADLPGPAPAQRSAMAPAPARAAEAGGPVVDPDRGLDRLRRLWFPWLRVAAILVPIWLLVSVGSRDVSGFWPAWVLGPWGVLLVLQSVGLANGGHRHPAVRRREGRRERRRGC